MKKFVEYFGPLHTAFINRGNAVTFSSYENRWEIEFTDNDGRNLRLLEHRNGKQGSCDEGLFIKSETRKSNLGERGNEASRLLELMKLLIESISTLHSDPLRYSTEEVNSGKHYEIRISPDISNSRRFFLMQMLISDSMRLLNIPTDGFIRTNVQEFTSEIKDFCNQNDIGII